MSRISGEIWRALFIWVLACALGLSIPPLVPYLFPPFTAIYGLFPSTLITTMPLSIAQWLALRWTHPVSILWIFSIPISVFVFMMIIRELPTDGYLSDETLAALTILGLMLGLLVGLPQWLILRWKYGASALWLLGSSLGVGLSMFFVLVTNLINMSGVLAYIAAVLVYALTTGLTLVVLINRHVVPDTPISESAGG
jgi:hypothetical protein